MAFNFSLFGWLVADGWCWFVLRQEHSWLVAGGWFVLRDKYCWLVADKPSEQGDHSHQPNDNTSYVAGAIHLDFVDSVLLHILCNLCVSYTFPKLEKKCWFC
jgi:hypothetical protein